MEISYFGISELDTPSYELIDDDDEEVKVLMAAIDAESSHRYLFHPRRLVPRERDDGNARIRRHYFCANPIYTSEQFRRRFWMNRDLFNRILNGVIFVDPYFEQRSDCTGLMGLSALQKMVASMRILTYGVPADATNEYVQIGESTTREALIPCCGVITAFGKEYLRSPTHTDVARLLQEEWRHCPTSWKGMFTGREKHPTMILEAAASHDLWIWHAYFGLPDNCNDINVLHRSPIFSAYVQGEAPPVHFTVNGRTYDLGYYLADVTCLCEEYSLSYGEKDTTARWAIIRGPAYRWDRERLSDIMTACIIMHNMTIEDEKSGLIRRGEALWNEKLLLQPITSYVIELSIFNFK
ncbi:hypothetical protein U9M48_024185, partial [Paspalum notatum var. saurae]